MGILEFKQAIDIPRNFSGILVKALDYTAKISASTKAFNQLLKSYLEEPGYEVFYMGSIEAHEQHQNLPRLEPVIWSTVRSEYLSQVKHLMRNGLAQVYKGHQRTEIASILLEFYYSGKMTNAMRFNISVGDMKKDIFIGLLTYIVGFARVACNGDPFLIYSYTRGNGTFYIRDEALENPPAEQVFDVHDPNDFWHVVIIRHSSEIKIVYNIKFDMFATIRSTTDYNVYASMGKVVKARKLKEIGFTFKYYVTDDDLVVYMDNKYCIISVKDSQYSWHVPYELLLVKVDDLLC